MCRKESYMSKQLGINKPMDNLALENGLGHWSCVSPLNCMFWVRSDGHIFYKGYGDAYLMSHLAYQDERYPIGKDWQQPTPITSHSLIEKIDEMNDWLSNGLVATIAEKDSVLLENQLNALVRRVRNYLGISITPLVSLSHFGTMPDDIKDVFRATDIFPLKSVKHPTLVQKPFQYPCDGALYFTKTCKHQAIISGFFGSDNKKIIGIVDGIRNNYFWCSETGKAVSPFGDTAISNDLIMMVWE